jgi:CheY-like chemotaxis protein
VGVADGAAGGVVGVGDALPDGRGVVLIVDDDAALAALVRECLTEEGYSAAVLATLTSDALRAAVDSAEPDCLLLDSRGPTDYGDSWCDAAWARARPRPVPVIMFTGSAAAIQEAEAGVSARARAAALAAVVAKPFDLDGLLSAVAGAVGRSRSGR